MDHKHLLYGGLYSTSFTIIDKARLNLTYIDTNIRYFVNLKELVFSMNHIEIVPKEIQYLIQLQKLNLSNNKIKEIPGEIQYLTELQELILSYNQLTEIPKEIQHLIQLQILSISTNSIKKIPQEICYLTQLQELKLSHNQIKEIPKEIQYLTQLQKLNLCNNKIRELPKEIGNLTQLNELILSHNQLREIPKEIGNLTQLRIVYLYINQLIEIPKEIRHLTELQVFDLSQNQLINIPNEIQYLTQLQILYLSVNKIKELPLEIINLRNLINFKYGLNPIENLLNPLINRFVQRIKNRGGNIHNLYTDTQNVHSSSIQQSIKDSIYNLMNEVKDDRKINYLDDSILSVQTKEALIEYSKDESIHSHLECTFEEVLQAVLLEINNLPNDLQIEVKNRLNEEMEDGLCKCFTGRISRLVNSLSGYSDKVSIKISSAEEIGNVISIMKNKYNEINEVKLNVEKELLERGYEKEVIDEWITYID